jgi:prefoldin subunit 5
MADDSLMVRELRAHIEELSRQIADLQRHNRELREAVAALLAPEGPDYVSPMRLRQ